MAATDQFEIDDETTEDMEASELNFQIVDSPVLETEAATEIEAPSLCEELFEDQDLRFEDYGSEQKSDLNFFPGARNPVNPPNSFQFPNARKSTGASPTMRSHLPPPLQELPPLQPIRTQFPQRSYRSPKSPFLLGNGNPLRSNSAQANSPRRIPPPPTESPSPRNRSSFQSPLSKTTFSPKPAFKTIRQPPKPIKRRSEVLEPTESIDFALQIGGATNQIIIPKKRVEKDDDNCLVTFEGSNWRKTTTTEAMRSDLEISAQAGKRRKRRKFQNPQSKFTGVSWCRDHERWAVVVQGKIDGKKMNRNIGIFPCNTEVRCARLYDLAAMKSGRPAANFLTEAAYKNALENHKRDDLTQEQMNQKVAKVQNWGVRLFTAKDLETLFPGVRWSTSRK